MWQLPFLLLLIGTTTWILNRQKAGSATFQHNEGLIFGTIWHATYQHGESIENDIVRALQEVDASMSMFNPNSTISRINRGESTQTDSLFCIVFTQAQQISEATAGDFDITVGPLVNAWGFGFKSGALPDSTQLDSIRSHVGWQKVSLQDGQLVKSDEQVVMDFSAIAKGFAVDCVASLFKEKGIKNYMIEIGGEIVLSGHNKKGNDWVIGVSKPVEDSLATNTENQALLHITDCAMATSGNYRNFYITKEGQKVSHTINPHTGRPAQQNILSSTVLAPTCAMADAFATSFMVMGLERAKQVLNEQPQLQAYFIYVDENNELQTWCTPPLKEKLDR